MEVKSVIVSITQNNMYKYLDSKKEHLHTFNDKPLIGTSSVGSVLAKPLTWWASGLAVKELGVPDPKVFTKMKKKQATQEEIDALNSSCGEFLTRFKDMSVESYITLLSNAYKAHSVKLADSAEEGVDLHAELERYVKNHILTQGKAVDVTEYEPRIQPFIDWTEKNVKRFLWS